MDANRVSGTSGADNQTASATTTTTTTTDRDGKRINAAVSRPPPPPPVNYELEGKKLREDIVEKVGQLQTVLATAIEVSRERRDMLSRRLLEQVNYRLERAKDRADKILSEVSGLMHRQEVDFFLLQYISPPPPIAFEF